MIDDNSETTLEIRGAVEGEAWETDNFREITAGSIAPGKLYRSSHPIYVDRCKGKPGVTQAAAAAGIATVLNLSDSLPEMRRNTASTPWYAAVIQAGNAIALGMDFSITSQRFCAQFAEGIRFMLSHPAPYLFHCFAGVDRTGFFAMVLEGFMDAALFEVIDDYLISLYGNPPPARSSWKYQRESVHIRKILAAMNANREVNDANLRDAAIGYLRYKAWLSDDELIALDAVLRGNQEEK